MKNLLIILAIITTCCSCQRERCWDCRITHYYQSTPDTSPVEDSTYRICGKTKDERNKHEQEMRRDSVFVNAQGKTDTLMYRTSCQKVREDLGDRLTPDLDLSWN